MDDIEDAEFQVKKSTLPPDFLKPKRSHHKKKPVDVVILEDEKKKVGRPKIEIDYNEVTRLAKMLYNRLSICKMMGFGITRASTDLEFIEAFNEGKEQAAHTIVSKQLELALNGNVAMLIHLGKNICGQSDKMAVQTENVVVVIEGDDRFV